MSPEAQAAWAQALLSVLAIGVAIAIPAQQNRTEMRRRADAERAQARAIALGMFSLLDNWQALISDAIEHYQEYPASIGTSWFWSRMRQRFEANDELRAAGVSSHLLGAASAAVQGYLHLLGVAHRDAEQAIVDIATSADEVAGYPDQYKARLQETLDAGDRAIAAMEAIFNT